MKAGQPFLSILVSEYSIKIAQVKGNSLSKLARRNVTGMTTDQLSKALKSMLGGFNTKSSNILCVIPGHNLTTKNIEIPSVDPLEIQSIINLQAGRYTPFSKDEILIGYVNIGSYQANHTRVLLSIVNRNVVKEKLSILQQAGLEAEQVVFMPESIAKSYAKALNVKKDSGPVVIVDVNEQTTNFVIESRGTIVAYRNIPTGFKHLSGGFEEVKKFSEEILQSVETFRGEELDKNPDSLIITSDHPSVKDLPAFLKDALNVSVTTTSYFDQLKWGGLKKKYQKDLNEDSYTEVIAPGLMAARAEIDLMPEEIRLKRTVEQQGVETTKAGILAVLVFILIGGVFLSRVYYKDAFLRNMKSKYAPQREEVVQLQTVMEKTRITREYLESRLKHLDAIVELYRIVPKEIYLQTISMDDTGTLTIEGISESMSRVFSLVSDLEDAPIFESVTTKNTSSKKDRGKDVAYFELSLKLVYDQQAAKAAPKKKEVKPAAAEGGQVDI